MSFDDFLQEASFTNLNWNGSSGKLRVRAGGEQNELKLPQTFVVDPKTSQYGWRAWVPQPEGNKKPFDQRVSFTEKMPAKSADSTVAALEAKTFFFQCYQDDWDDLASGVIEWAADQKTVFKQLIPLGRELQKLLEPNRAAQAVQVTITGSEKVGVNNNPAPAFSMKLVKRPAAFDEASETSAPIDDGDFG